MSTTKTIRVQNYTNAPVERVWQCYIEPEHIVHWNFADPSWECSRAENNLRVGGKFSYHMQAKDGSAGFDFGGDYVEVKTLELILYKLADGRQVLINFLASGNETLVTIEFDPENENSTELQQDGWQSILNNFKNYVENKN